MGVYFACTRFSLFTAATLILVGETSEVSFTYMHPRFRALAFGLFDKILASLVAISSFSTLQEILSTAGL